MIIHTMTATFGKLEHETLTLQPGLNIITGSNEWGKSTWCAFLAAMLYGVDTRAKSTRTALADKERFAPWSGSPMSGRMELTWRGRDITIERKTTGRVPMGDFRAYETKTGLPVPELTADTCGERLLGVERSVFLRTGFIRFRDMAITDDEALRRRLNNLVTTGDENSAADHLHKNLRELKNKIRYNRSGLLPQLEADRKSLEETDRELARLEEQCGKLIQRMDEIEDWRMALENHRCSLAYEAAREHAGKIDRAKQAREEAHRRFEDLSTLCRTLPEKETVKVLLAEVCRLEDHLRELEEKLRDLPADPGPEPLPEQFEGLSPEEALDWARTDADRYKALRAKHSFAVVFGLVLALAGGAVWTLYPAPGMVCCGVGLAVLIWALVEKLLRVREIRRLEEFYGTGDPEDWLDLAQRYVVQLEQREKNPEGISPERRNLEQQLKELNHTIFEATQGQGLELCRNDWEGALTVWNSLDDALREYRLTQEYLEALQATAKTVPAPEFPDRMAYSDEETLRLLADCDRERLRLEGLQGQYRGKMDALGARSEIAVRLGQVNERIDRLEQTYTALTIAQETLSEASAKLQRRFAPRIARRAEENMKRMTGGRYDRLRLEEDLSIRAGAENEDTLQNVLWRSDGTVDQLYLALRLAVSGELIPEAPLILDDALVRFDDQRLKAALDILKDEARSRQVILFTCQSRETNMR